MRRENVTKPYKSKTLHFVFVCKYVSIFSLVLTKQAMHTFMDNILAHEVKIELKFARHSLVVMMMLLFHMKKNGK